MNLRKVYISNAKPQAYFPLMDNLCICGRTALVIWQRLRCAEQPRLDCVRPLADRAGELVMSPARLAVAGIGVGAASDIWGRLSRALPQLAAPSLPGGHPSGAASRLVASRAGGAIGPLELLVGSRSSRHLAEGKSCRLWSGPLPPGSFLKLGGGLHVATPELVFLQLAQELDLPGLVALGFELCGVYARKRAGASEASRCQAVTRSGRIARYLEGAAGARGIQKARRAARLVVDESASFGETAMVALACMPRAQGGCGLPLPSMNFQVAVPAKQRKLIGRGSFFLDAYWPDARRALEYDGEGFHTDYGDVSRDRVRRDCLTALGVSCSSIGKEVLYDVALFDMAARRLAREIGCRLPSMA